MQSERVVEAHEDEGAAPSAVTKVISCPFKTFECFNEHCFTLVVSKQACRYEVMVQILPAKSTQ